MRVVCARDETCPWTGLASRRPTLSSLRYFARENAWTGRKRCNNAHLCSSLVYCNMYVTRCLLRLYVTWMDILRMSLVLHLCDKCGHFDIFYRKFHFLLISHKTHMSNKFLSISYLIYYLMYHIYYFNVKIQKIYKIYRKWIKKNKNCTVNK